MTTQQAAGERLRFQVSDVSGQHVADVANFPSDASVGEMVSILLADLNYPEKDSSGRDIAYHARLEREGRHLHASEMIGEAVRENDRIVIQPNIDAGAMELPR